MVNPIAILTRTLLRRQLRAVLLKDEAAWQKLYDEMRDAYTRAWDEETTRALAAALDRLRELGPGDFTEGDKATLMSTIEGRLGADAMRAALKEPVIGLSESIFRVGALEVGKAVGIDILFGRPDLDALEVLGQGNLYWVGNSWNAHTGGLFNAALDDYFREGMTRQDLTRRFATDFASLSDKGQRYWELLADHTATRTREIGRVTGYERAGVEYVQVRAHLDSRTSEICRAMHGRILTVTRLSEQRNTYLDAIKSRDLLGAKAAWTMHNSGGAITGIATSQLPPATASPPYHFLCRTITVAYFAETETPQQTWARKTFDRETLGEEEISALIAHCKGATWRDTSSATAHFDAHGATFADLAAYTEAAQAAITRADRDVYLSVRGGRLKALFAQEEGQRRWLAVVDVDSKELITYHRRDGRKFSARNDDVPALPQPGRGIAKWLRRWVRQWW